MIGEYAEVDLRRGISKLLPAPGNKLNENKVRLLLIKEELIQMSQIDIPFIAVNNKGLEVKNVTKSYDK